MLNLAKRLLLPGLIISVLVTLAAVATHYTSLDILVRVDTVLRSTIRSRPYASVAVGFVTYALASLVPGTAGKSIVLGWFYGLVTGVIIVNAALVLAALLTFVVIRHYFREPVRILLARRMTPWRDRISDDGAFYLLTLRMAHAPFTILNYVSAAGTDIPLPTFLWTTQIGLLPGNIVFVYAGTRLPTLNQLVQEGPLGVLDGPMMVALLTTLFVPWLVRRVFHIVIPGRTSVQQLR